MPKPRHNVQKRTKHHPHPLHEDLYTPMTPKVHELFARMRAEHGSWRRICALSGTRMKVFRNIRTKRKAVSQTVLDRMCSTTGVGGIHEFPWFTADDLVALGIWKPMIVVAGKKRYMLDEEWEVE